MKENGLSISEITSDHLVRTAVLALFVDSMEGGDRPLGDLAISLTCLLTDPDGPFGTDGIDLLYSIPILGHYGQLEEQYLRVSKEAKFIDTIGKGE